MPRLYLVRKLKHVTFFFIILILLYGGNILRKTIRDRKCSEEESRFLMDDLCQDFVNHVAAGNLCPALCDSKKLKYNKCTNYRGGKKVLIANCDGVCEEGRNVVAVIKSKHPKEEFHFEPLVLDTHKNGSLTKTGYSTAYELFNNLLNSQMLEENDKIPDIFSYLWSIDFKQFKSDNRNLKSPEVTALQNIWGLINQDEYLFMKVYQKHSFVPRIYGTCGFYYVMEYAPPGDILDPAFFTSSHSSFKERAKIAVDILDIVQSLDYGFFEPVHMCDVKAENFGIGRDHGVKILDSDSLFFHTSMLKNLAQPSCTSHNDCDFFDCRGWCDLETGKCTKQRTNNNLQTVCEDILIDRATNFYAGLLHNPPQEYKEELLPLLEECAYPGNSKGTIVREPASDDLYWRLHNLLKKAIRNM
ncbi:divergent protein kinase domain 1C-like [Saccostrea echinata]|uniref:divergent protein kinase domain 1C-like n=1 Tax=Saccostrea echinata TaxID=191078 RepID=UPI002A834998|nr:divergent protein kinase domain 1C-like [Saccostrea echinata]